MLTSSIHQGEVKKDLSLRTGLFLLITLVSIGFSSDWTVRCKGGDPYVLPGFISANPNATILFEKRLGGVQFVAISCLNRLAIKQEGPLACFQFGSTPSDILFLSQAKSNLVISNAGTYEASHQLVVPWSGTTPLKLEIRSTAKTATITFSGKSLELDFPVIFTRFEAELRPGLSISQILFEADGKTFGLSKINRETIPLVTPTVRKEGVIEPGSGGKSGLLF